MEHKARLWRRKSSEQEREKTLELERHVEELKEQLSFAHVESKTKDDILAKQLNEIKEATADCEKAKIEVDSLKKELASSLHQKTSIGEKYNTLETTLKECKEELHDLEEKHQQTVHDKSTKLTIAEQNALLMENTLIESNNNLEKLQVEYNNLSMILENKEKLINGLTESNYQLEARFTTLMEIQDFLDRENTSLKYEVHLLKKENNRLDTECQKLRVMVRKKLPVMSKMRKDVDVLDNVSIGSPRKNQILALEYHDSPNKRVASLIERLKVVEDENRILKETIVKKNEELQFTKTNLEENSKCQVKMGVSELSLMDDFIEMEKLAIVCCDKEPQQSDSMMNKQKFQSDMEKPLCKIIETIEGVMQKSFANIIGQQLSEDKDDKSVSASKQIAHVFQWEISEFCFVLQQFIVVCNNLLHGMVDFNGFIIELGSSLEWITSHCLPLQVEDSVSDMNFNDLKTRNEMLSTQLKESNLRIANLEEELLTLKCSKNLIEDQIENQRSTAEELGTQLTVSNSELNAAHKKISFLEVEFEVKSNYCDELEATCLELQLQLESMSRIGTPSCDESQEKNKLRTDCEISAVSEKLAECQATMLNLGKQLKSLATPNDECFYHKLVSPNSGLNLLEKMKAEDGAAITEYLKSPKTKEIICAPGSNMNTGLLYERKPNVNIASNNVPASMNSYHFNAHERENGGDKLVLVTKKHKGGASFFRKLLSRKKKEIIQKKALVIAN